MQIFPKQIIDHTVQAYIPKNTVKSKVIYNLNLSVVLMAICSLPFIKAKVHNTGRGMVKPSKERVPITSLKPGKVLFSNMENNKFVEKGDVLLILENNALNEQIALTEYDSKRYAEHIKDLEYLINTTRTHSDSIRSPKYKTNIWRFPMNV